MDHAQKFLELVKEAKSRIKEMTVEEYLNETEPHLLIDVRELEEWSLGHLPNAVHLSKGILERDIENIAQSKDQKIILYCGGGFRSALSADNLQKMGYTHVYSLDGGFKKWIKSNQPLSYD